MRMHLLRRCGRSASSCLAQSIAALSGRCQTCLKFLSSPFSPLLSPLSSLSSWQFHSTGSLQAMARSSWGLPMPPPQRIPLLAFPGGCFSDSACSSSDSWWPSQKMWDFPHCGTICHLGRLSAAFKPTMWRIRNKVWEDEDDILCGFAPCLA